MTDAIARAVAALNDALERDPEAITELVNLRVDCNARLASHPTVQVGDYDGQAKVGVLGLINGILAPTHTGVVGARGQQAVSGGGFIRVERFVDLRTERTDIVT